MREGMVDRAWWHNGVRNMMFVVHALSILSLHVMGLAKLDKNVAKDAKKSKGKRKTTAVTAASKDGAFLQENIEPDTQACFHLDTPQYQIA